MLTRAEVESNWTLCDGRVVSPGKFEGEPVFAPALFDLVMQGFADESDGDADLLEVSDELRAEFPEVGDTAAFVVWTDERGFFFVEPFKDVENARLRLEERAGEWVEE